MWLFPLKKTSFIRPSVPNKCPHLSNSEPPVCDTGEPICKKNWQKPFLKTIKPAPAWFIFPWVNKKTPIILAITENTCTAFSSVHVCVLFYYVSDWPQQRAQVTSCTIFFLASGTLSLLPDVDSWSHEWVVWVGSHTVYIIWLYRF